MAYAYECMQYVGVTYINFTWSSEVNVFAPMLRMLLPPKRLQKKLITLQINECIMILCRVWITTSDNSSLITIYDSKATC